MINNSWELISATSKDPRAFASVRHYAGAIFVYLLKKFGDTVPEGFVCGRTFKVQRKGVTLMDRFYPFPFELEEFEKYYCELQRK